MNQLSADVFVFLRIHNDSEAASFLAFISLVFTLKIEYPVIISLNKEIEIDIPQAITETLNKLFDPSKKYIGIAPGSNTPTRIWSFDKYLEVAKFYERKNFNIVFFLGPEEQNLRKKIIDTIDNPLFPEEEVENFPGIEVVMASTNYLDIAITNDSGTGQMLSTNMCPLLKICGPTSAVKFLNDQFTNINFIASQSFGGDDINLITSDAVINEIDKILDS